MVTMQKTIDVLGTPYTLKEVERGSDPKLTDRNDGYTDTSIRECVVDNMNTEEPGSKANLQGYKKGVIRHELIHAFLFESGLDSCSWAVNEEMIDWLALQFPKMRKAFEEADAL